MILSFKVNAKSIGWLLIGTNGDLIFGISLILNNTCCNNVNKKIKQIKKVELWVWCLWTQIRILNDIKCRICVVQSKKTNNDFFISAALEITFSRFLDFFKSELSNGDTSFWVRPSQDRKWILFFTLFLLFGCVLEETHDTNYIKVGSQVPNGGQKLICTLMLL